jgi:phage terminase large subunit
MKQLNIEIDKRVILPVYQEYMFDYSYRYNIYWGGRGSGKTKFIIQKLLVKGLKEKRMILLMRKETVKLRDSLWKEINDAIDEFGLRDYFTFNKTEFRITCNLNGTEFKCMGLDDPEKIKGFANISDVFLDEITAFTEEDVELIDGTLRSKRYKLPLQFYATFNPISKANFVYKYFGFADGITPPQTFILHTTYLDNPFLAESYIQKMQDMRERNYNRWKIEALGEFVSLDKLIFQNYKVEEFDHTAIKGELLVGLDFGFVNDISALTCSLLDEANKKLYIFKEWGDTGKTNSDLAAIISSLGLSKSVIVADCAEMKSIEELKRLGISRIIPCSKGADSVIHGIQKLQQYEIIIHPSCEGVITEFENYSWQKDKNGEYINKPIDKFNHYIDSLRYSLQCVENRQRLQTMNKSILGL